MPEMTVSVRWPDGREADCYSPSLVMHDYLESGRRYSVAEFRDRAEQGLAAASDRVRDRHGFACTAAAASAAQIRATAATYPPEAEVLVVDMAPPLPAPSTPDDAAHAGDAS